MTKAIALISGGLDSLIAAKLVKKQGIDVKGICFTTPFKTEKSQIEKNSKQLGIPIKKIETSKDYLKIIRNPKHGYGSGMNPCIDCRIYFLKKAWEIAKQENAKFLITGEVVGQRPMSQQMKQLKLIEKETRLQGKILRPLSAKLLPPTKAEKWIDRDKLFDIQGRTRKKQLELAEKLNIKDYSTPAGGCLLTEKEYSRKIKDLLQHQKKLSKRDYLLLQLGRHFRTRKNKIIVGRNEEENKKLTKIKNKKEYSFEVPNTGSPITILQGPKTEKAIKTAAELTARYSDTKKEEVKVCYGEKTRKKQITVKPMKKNEIEKIRI